MTNSSEEWYTRRTLIERACDQDDDHAWEDFVQYYKSFLKVVLNHLKLNQEDLQDVTQEVLIKLWKSLKNFEYNPEKARFRTWLNRMIRNAVIDFYRKKNRITQKESHSLDDESLPEELQVLEESSNEIDDFIEKEWRVHISNLAMDNVEKSFSGHAVEVFKRSLDGQSPVEIAEAIGIAESSIYKLRKRVEQRLVLEIQNLKKELEF